MDILWSPWRYQYVTTPASSEPSQCFLCSAAQSRDDEAHFVVHRAEHNFVILNRFPYAPGHIMIAPHRHVATLAAAGDAAIGEMTRLVMRCEQAIEPLYRARGINIGMNIGECAGAGVAGHIHMHIVPRWPGDFNFMTTIGETRVLSEELPITWRRWREALRA